MSHMTKSAEAVASNEDLLTQILIRLLIRSIFHFKSVSKHRLYLITNPRLSLLCSSSPVSPSGLFIPVSTVNNPEVEYEYLSFNNEPQSKPPFRSLTFALDQFGIKIIQSCSGLFLCSNSRRPTRYSDYYIYNPTTNEHVTLPPLSGNKTSLRTAVEGMILAFEPTRSPHYKVICVSGSGFGHNFYQIVIYSSQTRIWRESGQPFMTVVSRSFEWGVYWNGAIHQSNPALYFQLDEEQFEKMHLPPLTERYNEGGGPSYFGQSNGYLHFVETYGSLTRRAGITMHLNQLILFEVKRKRIHSWCWKYPTALRYNIMDKSFVKVCDYPPLSDDLDSNKTRLR